MTTKYYKDSSGREHAVVLGAGMAGLLSARVLSDHFENVTIAEKDTLTPNWSARRSTPQANHVHLFLAKGQQIVKSLFPGFESDLNLLGIPVVRFGKTTKYFNRAGEGKGFSPTIDLNTFSRPFVESWIRKELQKNTRIRFCPSADVTGLHFSDRSVTGVFVKHENGTTDLIGSNIVVDATGRGSQAPAWLGNAGFPQPKETVVLPHVGYATRIYKVPKNHTADWNALYVQQAPPNDRRGGIILPIENGRWVVTLIGVAKDYPSASEEGFYAFAKSLRVPVLHEAIKDAEPASGISIFRNIATKVRHWERVKEMPRNFVLVGDSTCIMNPIYGQGMTAAAMGAIELGRWIGDGGLEKGQEVSFQGRLWSLNRPLWQASLIEDMRSEETEYAGGRAIFRLAQRYMNHVFHSTTKDEEASRTFWEVLHLLKPQSALISPNMIGRLLRTSYLE